MLEIRLPAEAWHDVEASTEALVDRWLVAVGERVEAGQVLGEVVLVKATYELLAPAAGVITALEVAAEQNFARDAVLVRLAPG